MCQEIPLVNLLRWCCQIHQLVITIWHCIFSIMMDARQEEPYSTIFHSSTPMEHFQAYWIKGPAMQSSSHERLVRVLLRSARRTKASLYVKIWLHMASSCCCSMAWNLVSVFDFRVSALSPRVCLGVLQEGHQSQNGGKQSGLVLRKSSV